MTKLVIASAPLALNSQATSAKGRRDLERMFLTKKLSKKKNNVFYFLYFLFLEQPIFNSLSD
jgi:hypothetical protein